MRRMGRLLVGVGFVLGREISGESIELLVLFVRDRLAGTTERVSVATSGAPG